MTSYSLSLSKPASVEYELIADFIHNNNDNEFLHELIIIINYESFCLKLYIQNN
jgi:hypothetical protein